MSLFPPEFSRIDVGLQVAVNKLLRLNPNFLQACHFPNPRITKFIKIPKAAILPNHNNDYHAPHL